MTAAVEEIRRAAALMRERETEPWALAVANWLDYAAESWGETDVRFVGRQGAHITPALAVARAYLGDRP